MKRISILIVLLFFVCSSAFARSSSDRTLGSDEVYDTVIDWLKEEALREAMAKDRTKTLDKIIAAVGGQEAYDSLPILDIKDRRGDTGYIDFIKPEELRAPIMKGIDKYNRLFITFKWRNLYSGEVYATTIFQRYSDNQDAWSIGAYSGRHAPIDLLGVSGGLNNGKIEKFAKLVNGEEVENDHRVRGELVTDENELSVCRESLLV